MGSSEPRPPGCMALILELLREAYAPVVASMAARAAESESRARRFADVGYPRVNSPGRKRRRLDFAVGEPCAPRRNETLSPVRPAADPTSDDALSLFSTPSLGMPTTNEWRPCDFGASSPGRSIGVSVAEAFAVCLDSSPAAAAVTAAFLAASAKPLFGGMADDERSRSSGASSPARSVAAEPIALWSDRSPAATAVKAAFLAAIKTPAFEAIVDADPPRASGALSPGPSVLGEPAAAASPGNDAALSAPPDLPALGSPLAACVAGDLTAGSVDSVQSTCSGGGDISAATPACLRMSGSVGAAPTDADRVTRTYQALAGCSGAGRPDCFGLGVGACLAPIGLAKVLRIMGVAGKSVFALGAGNSSGRFALAARLLGATSAFECEYVVRLGSSLPPASRAQEELFCAVRGSHDFQALCAACDVALSPDDDTCYLVFWDACALVGVPEGTDVVFCSGVGIGIEAVTRLLRLSAACARVRVLGVLAPQLAGLCYADDVLLVLNTPAPGCVAHAGGAWSFKQDLFVSLSQPIDVQVAFRSVQHAVWIFERSAPVPDSAAPLAAGAPSGQGPGPAVPPRAALAGQAGCGGAASVWKPVEPAAFSTREALRAAVELWCSDRIACYDKFGPMERWDTSRVCDMSNLFADLAGFNGRLPRLYDVDAIGDWDVSSVRSMRRMFDGAVSFNAPLGKWDVSRVEDMSAMFRNARAFDQPLGGWDVGRVTSMQSMFEGAVAFNRPLAKWIVSSVTDMRSMFRGAVSFNRPLAKWDVSSVIDMRWMFCGAVSFNQPLSKWDVSGVLFAIGLRGPSEEACECQCECIAQRRVAAPYARVLVAPPRQGWRDIPSFGALPWVTMCDACYEHLEARRDADCRPGCYCVVRFSSLESGPRALGAVLRRSSVSTEAGQLATALGVACGGGSKSLIQGGRMYCSTGITKSKADKTRSARDDAMWAEQMLDVLFLICVLSGLDALPPPAALLRFGRFGREFIGAIGPKDMQCPHFDWMAAGVFQVITMLRAASRATLVFNVMRKSDLLGDCELTYGATAEQLADPAWVAAVERFASVLHAAAWARAVKQIPLAYGDLAAGDVSILAADTAHAGPGVPEGETRQVHAALCSLSLDTALLRAEPKQMQALEVLARLGLPQLVADCDGDEPLPYHYLLEWATEEFLQFVSQKTVAGPWSAADFRRLKKRLKKGKSSESFLTQLVAKSWRAFLEQPDFWE